MQKISLFSLLLTLVILSCSSESSKKSGNKEELKKQTTKVETSNKEKAALFNGEETDNLNPKLIKTTDGRDITHLMFEIDALPYPMEDLHYLIPMEQIEKYKKANRSYALHFQDREIPSASLTHQMNMEFSDETQNSFIEQDVHKERKDEKNTLNVKGVKRSHFPLIGSIKRVNLQDTTKSKKIMMAMHYDDQREMYTIYEDEKPVASIAKAEIKNLAIANSKPTEKEKYLTLIQLLNVPHKKYLKENNFYTLPIRPSFVISNDSEQAFSMSKFDENKLYLKYKYTTKNMDAVIELKSKLMNIKYLADHDSGYIKGMQAVFISEDGLIADMIKLYVKNKPKK